jgi:MarR family transcriptional regulator for hemolysin
MSTEIEIHPEAAVAPGYLANHAARVFNRAVDDGLRPHGLTLALIGPLLLLSWKGAMLQRDMVRASAIKQPAMVALLDKLEGAAIGRTVLLDVNAMGVAGFSDAEAAQLVGLLVKLIANLENTAKN